MKTAKQKFILKLVAMQFVIILFVIVAFPPMVSAISPKQAVQPDPSFYNTVVLSIALSVSIPCFGAAYALKSAISSAISALTERPSIGGMALIFVALAEAIAIYGLIIAIMLMQYLPAL
ncbi:MAG: ATP synthase subunit C [Promethearchaeota archaeon]